MSKEAMKLALEALEYIYEGSNNQGPFTGISWRCVSNKAEPAIKALEEALAKQEQGEPVAKNENGSYCLLYTHPPKSFTYEQVKAHIRAASMSANDISVGSDTTEDGVSIVICRRDEILYAEFFAYTKPQPSQKPWVGLTDEERGVCINSNFGTGLWLMAKDIEAKLKEKNCEAAQGIK